MNPRFNRLPEEMKDAIHALKELHGTPDAMALPVVLGTANLAAMKLYNVDSGGIYGVVPISEFFLCMAPTGALKTTNYKETSVAIKNYQTLREDELRDEHIRHALDQKVFKKQQEEYLKMMDTDPALARVPTAVRPIETADYIIGKATLNGIIEVLTSQSFVGLFSSEGGEFFNAHSFQGRENGKAIEMVGALTSMWDGSDIDRNTGMSRTKLRDRRVNMLFLLQTETVQAVLNTPVFSEQGFVHRLLISQCNYYEKPDWEIGSAAQQRRAETRARLDGFHSKIARMLAEDVSVRANRHFELDLPVMRQTDDALAIMADFYNRSKMRGEPGGDLQNYSGFAARLHEHALRLAATIAAFEGSGVLQKSHAECGIDLIEYFVEQRLAMEIGVADYNPNRSAGANKMGIWLQERRWTGTLNELRQYGPGWFRKLNTTQRDEIIADLLKDEVIELVETVATNGRATKIIQLI